MDVTMPQLGETVTEGTITRWLKQVGDSVEADEPLFEVSTDKVDSEVPAPRRRRRERDPRPRRRDGRSRHWPRGARRAVPPPPRAVPVPAAPRQRRCRPAPSARRARRRPRRRHRPRYRQRLHPAVTCHPGRARGRGEHDASLALTSPIVRRLVAERGLDPSTIEGTGPGGRLTRKDVLDRRTRAAPAPPVPPLRPHLRPGPGAPARRRLRRAASAAPACRP